MNNKELIERGLKEFASGNVEALRTLLHEDFLEHSPGNPSGRDEFVEFLTRSPLLESRMTVKRIVAEGPYVMVHHHATRADDERGAAVVDIWRLEDGLIVEHWDVVQPVPDPAAVPNGMF
ncbi:nuclear transport factor 2 family protein [Actinophytocola oryzae]|uniref:Putative SnoaL-like aldol condensation-catalyzing enzyme n=1 Tax=Actinophytocola oryzae TaxID=502181 RepID=A0A4V6Q6I5_9PSEU|nr:nuclear transport factor 2 family protein [Actinophytocola oryzae]TDV40341.1 putative SnoaL-like aldol condensation-catalyzing enzyme [Actinophytocola oryzae]